MKACGPIAAAYRGLWGAIEKNANIGGQEVGVTGIEWSQASRAVLRRNSSDRIFRCARCRIDHGVDLARNGAANLCIGTIRHGGFQITEWSVASYQVALMLMHRNLEMLNRRTSLAKAR